MLKRTITGAFIAIAACIVLYFSYIPEVMPIACVVMAAFSVYELCHATGYSNNEAFLTVSLLVAVGLSSLQLPHYEQIIRVLFPVTVIGFAVLMILLKRSSFKNPLKVIALNLTVILLFQAFPTLRRMNQGLYYLAGAMIACAITDVAAYLVGRSVGKHKLIPSVSPNKTVEGSLGGLLFTIFTLLLLGIGLEQVGVLRVDYPKLAVYSVMASIVGQFGDLSMSAVKRVCGIKDFGNIFPGHGGMLDRFDSQLLVVPFTLLYCGLTGGFIL